MPAVPALIMGGSSLVSSLIGAKSARDTSEAMTRRSPEELALMQSQTGLANQQRGQGEQLFGQAMPAIQNTLRYYQTLLGGSRGARMAAVSPEAQDTAAAYSGADAALERSNLRGGELAAQKAENSRSKAGSIARLVTGVRPGAASAAGGMGMGMAGLAGQLEGGAGAINDRLIGNMTQNRQQGNLIGLNQGNKTSANMGALFARLMGQFPKLGKGKWGFGGGDDGGGGGGGWDPEMG